MAVLESSSSQNGAEADWYVGPRLGTAVHTDASIHMMHAPSRLHWMHVSMQAPAVRLPIVAPFIRLAPGCSMCAALLIPPWALARARYTPTRTFRCRPQLPKMFRHVVERMESRLEEQESNNRVQAFEIKCAIDAMLSLCCSAKSGFDHVVMVDTQRTTSLDCCVASTHSALLH